MKKLVLILTFLIAGTAAGVYFILPTNIKWEKYVQEISANVRARTGVTLNIQGTPVFSMKPSPSGSKMSLYFVKYDSGRFVPQSLSSIACIGIFES